MALKNKSKFMSIAGVFIVASISFLFCIFKNSNHLDTKISKNISSIKKPQKIIKITSIDINKLETLFEESDKEDHKSTTRAQLYSSIFSNLVLRLLQFKLIRKKQRALK